MDWIKYFLIFLAICVVWFVITRVWVNIIDSVISAFKKISGLNKNDNVENWHTLEDIRNENKKDD